MFYSYNQQVYVTRYLNARCGDMFCVCSAFLAPICSLVIYLIHLSIDSRELLPPPILLFEPVSTGCHLSAPAPIGVDSPNPFLTQRSLRPQRFLNSLTP